MIHSYSREVKNYYYYTQAVKYPTIHWTHKFQGNFWNIQVFFLIESVSS
jgi:hypothetical protein